MGEGLLAVLQGASGGGRIVSRAPVLEEGGTCGSRLLAMSIARA